MPTRIAAAPVRTPTPARVARPAAAPVQARAQPQSLFQQGISFFERNAAAIRRVPGAVGSVTRNIQQGTAAFRQVTGRPAPTAPSTNFAIRAARDTFGRVPVRNVQTALRTVRNVNTVQSFVTSAVRFPGQAITAASNIRQAIRSGTAADRNAALDSTRSALSSARNVATGLTTVVRPPPGTATPTSLLQRLRPPSGAREITTRAPVARAIQNTIRTVRTVAGPVTAAITDAATRLASGSSRRVAGAIINGGSRLLSQGTRLATQGASVATQAATRLASTGAGRVATRVVSEVAQSSAARIAGRAAARFVPGANVAMAALDTAAAVRTWNDPNANTGQRVTSIITAAGSWAAATNVPILSQAGAAVSTVSSIVGAFF